MYLFQGHFKSKPMQLSKQKILYQVIEELRQIIFKTNVHQSVADPGFPVGGGGAPTSDVYTFQ